MMIIYSSFSYIMSISFFFFGVQPFMFWVVMEMNLIFFVYLMFVLDLKKSLFNEEYMMYYFMIQSFGSFMYLFSIYLKVGSDILSDVMFVLSISLKLGIFPLYFWILALSGSLSNNIFILILTLQKVPMFMLMFSLNTTMVLYLLLFSMIFGSLMMFFSKTLLDILIFSSIYSSFWIYLIYFQNIYFYLLFFLTYFFSLIFLFKLVDSYNLFKVMFMVFICGLPPFSLFFFKFFFVFFVLNFNSKMIFFVVWLFSFVSLYGYLKFFYSSFFFKSSFYINNSFYFFAPMYFVFPIFFLM